MSRILPPDFCENIRRLLPAQADTLLSCLSDSNPEVSVRVNTLKGACVPSEAETVPWCPTGYYLPTRPVFSTDPAWHQGLYYVQDASSMAVAEAVRHILKTTLAGRSGLRCLDACAAPGGKTGAVIETLPYDSFIIANEFDPHRANILAENLCKLGAPNVAISRGSAQKFGTVGKVFDLILADVPCSGEGMMRKEEEAVAQWQPGLVRQCAALQRDILTELWKALKPGGVLIYSTCTFNREENEDNLAYLTDELGAEAVALPFNVYSGIIPGLDGATAYRFLPGLVRGEGLFMCAVYKPAEGTTEPRQKRKTKVKSDVVWQKFASEVLSEPERFIATDDGTAIPAAHAEFVGWISENIRFLRRGLPLGTIKGRDIIPSHELAMSNVLRRGHFPTAELAYPAAFSYLRGEGISEMPAELPRGYFLATYGEIPLGFAKNIGNRANNLYPDYLRVRLPMSAMPETAPAPLVRLSL